MAQPKFEQIYVCLSKGKDATGNEVYIGAASAYKPSSSTVEKKNRKIESDHRMYRGADGSLTISVGRSLRIPVIMGQLFPILTDKGTQMWFCTKDSMGLVMPVSGPFFKQTDGSWK